MTVIRKWGEYTLIKNGPGYKIKELIIKPRQAISLQYHEHRSETWCIVQGKAQVDIDGRIIVKGKGESFIVEPKQVHRVRNISEDVDLVAIEVWMGDILEEDDIVRIDEGVLS